MLIAGLSIVRFGSGFGGFVGGTSCDAMRKDSLILELPVAKLVIFAGRYVIRVCGETIMRLLTLTFSSVNNH